jgi:hypothetical protein
MDIITNFLVQVNTETGKAENAFNIEQFKQRFSFKSTADYVVRRSRTHIESEKSLTNMQDLQLDKQDRQIVMKGRMKRKGNTSSEASDLQVFLFDHYLVFAKIKYVDYLETYKAYRKVNIYIYIKRERESIYLLLFLFKAYTT